MARKNNSDEAPIQLIPNGGGSLQIRSQIENLVISGEVELIELEEILKDTVEENEDMKQTINAAKELIAIKRKTNNVKAEIEVEVTKKKSLKTALNRLQSLL